MFYVLAVQPGCISVMLYSKRHESDLHASLFVGGPYAT